MTLNIASLAPLRIGTTVLATEGLQLPPEVTANAFRHSGNEYPSAHTVPGAAPRFRFSTPWKPAYDLIGFKALQATVVDIYLAKFSAGLRSTSTDHFKYSLNTSAKALLWIAGIRCGDRGIAMADVEGVLISSDGLAYPLAAPSTGALPTLASQPALHTLGTSRLNGANVDGAAGVAIDFNANVISGINGNPGDGLLYPTVAQYLGGAPTITVEHGDPVGILAGLGYTGAALSSSFVQWFRTYDATTQLALATGVSITAASGRAIPVTIGGDNQQIARGGFRVDALSADTTHPLVVGTGSVP